MRPFVAMVWAAVTSKPAGAETYARVAARRVKLPIYWLHAFAVGSPGLDTPREFPRVRAALGPALLSTAPLREGVLSSSYRKRTGPTRPSVTCGPGGNRQTTVF